MASMSATLTWQRALQFAAETGTTRMILDSDAKAGPSPVEALVLALAGCMGIDVADILAKGRHSFRGIEARLSATRAEQPPRRVLAVTMEFEVRGEVPVAAVERAIQLSRDKYCSVWHSMRQDIAFDTRVIV